MIVERIGFEFVADDGDESVEGFAHVDRRGAERDACVGRDRQHDAKMVRSSTMYLGDTSINRNVIPLGITISTG